MTVRKTLVSLVLAGVLFGLSCKHEETKIQKGFLPRPIVNQKQASEAQEEESKLLFEGQEKKEPKLLFEDINPEYSLRVFEWKPLDVTNEFKDIPSKDLFKLENTGEDSSVHLFNRKVCSRDRNWFFSKRKLLKNEYTRGLLTEGRRELLFDCESQRIYDLRNIALGTSYEQYNDGPYGFDIADNGRFECFFLSPEIIKRPIGPVHKSIDIIGDIKASRIYVFEEPFLFSEKGNAILLFSKSNDAFAYNDVCVFDLDALQILYQYKEGGDEWYMNYDASFLSFHKGLMYHRINTKNQDREPITRQNLTKENFRFSPDGNFCAWKALNFGPSFVGIRRFDKNEYHRISIQDYVDYPLRVENDGTIYARSGTYKYQDGKYVWTFDHQRPDHKEKPEGLTIN
jgi:hypothetical protein